MDYYKTLENFRLQKEKKREALKNIIVEIPQKEN